MPPQSNTRSQDQATGDQPVPQERQGGVKRYTLVLPEDLFDAVQSLATQRQTTVVDLLRRFIKLGLIAARLEATPDAALIIREGDTEREILLL